MSVRSPIFVVAAPGSGAGVLFELLDRAQETVRLSAKDVAKIRKVSPGITEEQASTLRDVYRDAARRTRRVVVSDLARHGLSIPVAHALWPQARFVYLYRDAAEHIATAHAASVANAESWETTTRAILDNLGALPATTWCAVNYADLLEDADSEAQWLGKLLGLTWTSAHPNCGIALRRHRAAAALRRGSAGLLPNALLQLAQRTEALQQRHHPAWVAGDVAKVQRVSSRRSVERFQRAVVSSRVAAGLCLAAVLPQAARAATYQVTNTSDSGAGSLRDAITQANGNAGADTITFASSANGTITLANGVLKITDSLTIQGPGSTALAVDGNQQSCVFYPYSKTSLIDVTISGLTVQNGNSVKGGGITSMNANLSLEDSVVQNSNGTTGGGVFVTGSSTTLNPNINIVNCTVKGNHATGGGGAIALAAAGNMVVEVSGSILQNNTANFGGGAYIAGGTQTMVTIANSAVLDNNSTRETGGVHFTSVGSLLVQNSNISGNHAGGNTGGLYATQAANFVIDSSTISSNTTGNYGGAIQAWGNPVTITASTVANNVATRGAGGVWVGPVSGESYIVDSTITGNQSKKGAGLLLYGSTTVQNSTVSANQATSGAAGGIFLDSNAVLTLHNTIVAENTATTGSAQLSGTPGTSAAVRFSLVSDANDVAANSNVIITANTNNVLGQNPNLGSLGSHGGLTATLVPAYNSPAINAGDPNRAGLPTDDQRGFTRVAQGRVDIGAVELQVCSNSNTLEGQGSCVVGSPTGGTTTGGATTGGATTGGGSHGGGGSGCATAPTVNNTFAGVGFLAAATGLLRRRRRS